MLQPEHGLGVEQVRLSVAAPLVLAADRDLAVDGADAAAGVRRGMAPGDLLGDRVELDAAELGAGAGEVPVDQGLRQPDRLEDLGTGVGRNGRHAHLRHHLEHALAQAPDQVLDRDLGLDGHVVAVAGEVLDRLHGEVRVDRRGAVPDQERDVVHLADVAGLDHQPDLGAGLLADQMVVDGAGQEQRRDRRELGSAVPVGQHDHARAVGDGVGHLGADLVEPAGHGRAAALDLVEAAADVGDEARHVAVAVDVPDLGEVVVVEDRERQHDLPARGRVRVEQVGLRADGAGQRRDQLLADRVEGRVGHLGEHLREVVEQESRLVAERCDRRVGAHRAERLDPGVGHRGEQDPQLLLGVAEDLLATGDRGVGVHDVLALGDVVEVDQAGVQPLVVRVLLGELALDLLVLDDPVLVGVDQEHPAGLEPPLAHDRGRVEVEHADLGGQHDQPVVGDPVAARAQPVAVEHRADLRAVGEDHARGAVPRLHQRGVERVERLALGAHLLMVLPGLRDHHQHRVGQAAAGHVQQLQHLVEARGVGRARRADREQPLELPGDQVGLEQRLAGPHPVAVAHHGVDLTVVGDVAERVGQRPAGERVRREPRVHDRHRRGDPPVGQVGEEVVQLVGGEHALVQQRAGAQRAEVDLRLALGALAQAERQPLQRHPGEPGPGRGHEQLAEQRHHAPGRRAQELGVDRDVAPAQDDQALLVGELLDPLPGLGHPVGVPLEEGRAHGVRTGAGKLEVDHLGQEAVRHLEQDPRAVAGVGLGAGGATVVEVAQGRQRLRDDVVAGVPGQGGHEGDAAGVVLEAWVVEPLGGRASVQHAHRPVLPSSAPGSPGDRARRAGDGVGPSAVRLPSSTPLFRGLLTQRTAAPGGSDVLGTPVLI